MSKTIRPKWGKIDKTARVAPKTPKKKTPKKTPDEMAEDGKLAYILLDSGIAWDGVMNIVGSKKYIRKCVLHWIVSGNSDIYGKRGVR